ncbi:hypothetical protein GCM10025795_35260 [Verticiella sediminum]
MKPWAFQPFQYIWGFRPSVHQIPHGKQPVPFGCKLDGGERSIEPTKMTVNVTHGEITAISIQGKALDSGVTDVIPNFHATP